MRIPFCILALAVSAWAADPEGRRPRRHTGSRRNIGARTSDTRPVRHDETRGLHAARAAAQV